MSSASQAQVVAAYFDKQSDAENAVRDLQAAGFRSDQIGSSFEDLDQSDYADTTEDSNRSLTSDQYSPNSATSSVSAHHESFWDKVKDFFSGETTDSDINDHTTTNREYAHVSDRAYAGAWNGGMLIPDRYRDRLIQGGGLVTVHASDRLDEAQQILQRNNGEISQDAYDDFGKYELGSERQQAGTPGLDYSASSNTVDYAAGMGQGTRADITGGETQQNPEVIARNERERGDLGDVASAVGTGPNATSLRDREADPAYATRAGAQTELPEDNAKRRIRMVSDVLRERSRQSVADASNRRSAEGVRQDLEEDADSGHKIA